MDSIVFLPGLLCDARLWQAQTSALAGVYNCLVPALDGQDNIPALAQHVLTEAPERFNLVALSMGGYVAMEIMRQAPERVTRLMLCDTSARADTPDQKVRRQTLLTLSRSGKFKGVTPRLLPSLIHPDRLEDKTVTEPILAMAERIGREGFQRQQTAIMGRIDSRPFLPQINCPAMIVVGANDQLTPLPIAQEMASLIPHAALEIIPHCGHLPPLELPATLNQLLFAWLKTAARTGAFARS